MLSVINAAELFKSPGIYPKKKSVPCLKDFIPSSPKRDNLNSENENGPYIHNTVLYCPFHTLQIYSKIGSGQKSGPKKSQVVKTHGSNRIKASLTHQGDTLQQRN